MAKSNGKAAVAELPQAVQEVLGEEAPVVNEQLDVDPAPVVPDVKVGKAVVEVPLGPIESRFPSPRIDLRLTGEPVFQMHCILTGLKATKQRLRNDMPIRSVGDAIRWLLEQIKLPAATQREVEKIVRDTSLPARL